MPTFDFGNTVEFDAPDSGATRVLSLSADLTDSAAIQENREEFRDLSGDVVNFVFDTIRNMVEDITVTSIEMDLDLDDYARWESDVDRIFLNLKAGFFTTHTLTRDITGASVTSKGVREFRLTRNP